jgi:hypothetical protein
LPASGPRTWRQKFAVRRHAAHQAGAHVAEVLLAGHVAHGLPFFPRGFDGGVGQAVGFAGGVFHAHLQAHTGGADDVVLAHAAELAGVVVVVDQVAPTAAQAVQVGAQLFVDGQRGGQPVGREPVNPRGLEAAHLGALGASLVVGWPAAHGGPGALEHVGHRPNLT